MRRITTAAILTAVLAASVAVTAARSAESPSTATEAPVEVFVSIPPQGFIVSAIGGERVNVHVLIQPGQEPHTFEPTPRQMVALAGSRMYFRIGMPFENRLVERIAAGHANLDIVDMAAGIKRIPISAHDPSEARADEAQGEDLDPHVWLSPALVKVLAQSAEKALCAADPAGADHYKANLAAFAAEADATDADIRAALESYRGRTIYVFHPAFGYFAAAYGLAQEAVEVEGKSPTPKMLEGLIARAKSQNVHVIFVQPQFDRRSAEVVARAIDGAVVRMDPLSYDIFANLRSMAAEVEKALSGGTAPTAKEEGP